MIVVDASVIVKWFVPEVGDGAAKALLSKRASSRHPSSRIEVSSALIGKALRHELTGTDVQTTLEAWFRSLADGQIALLPHEDDIEAATKLALELQHPLPDCLYLATADRLGVGLITADRAFVRRAECRSSLVQLLEEAAG